MPLAVFVCAHEFVLHMDRVVPLLPEEVSRLPIFLEADGTGMKLLIEVFDRPAKGMCPKEAYRLREFLEADGTGMKLLIELFERLNKFF